MKQLKLLIYLFMFVLGMCVGYGFFVLHWLSDYTAPQYKAVNDTQITNITSITGYTCETFTSPNSPPKTTCEKK